MATQAKAAPKKSSGFKGIKNAFIVILICFGLGFGIYTWMGEQDPSTIWHTINAGGPVVSIIFTLLLTVITLSLERVFAISAAIGKRSLGKFIKDILAAIKAGEMDKALALCDKQGGSVANVVRAAVLEYQAMEGADHLDMKQKLAKITQAHEEALQMELPTLQMNMPIIATITTLGTLTALFGTVVGMIKSFQALANGGGGDSLELSRGISEALINTASGILTSWVAVVAYNFFGNRIDKVLFALGEVGYAITATYESNHK